MAESEIRREYLGQGRDHLNVEEVITVMTQATGIVMYLGPIRAGAVIKGNA